MREAVEPLLRAGVLVEPDSEHGYLPATSPATISLEHALAAFAEDIVLREEACAGAAAPGPRS